MKRREFLKDSVIGATGLVAAGSGLLNPTILTAARTQKNTSAGELSFFPQYVQRGQGAKLLDWAYATDSNWDSFHSNITANEGGVKISDAAGQKKFGIDVRWNVEDFGYLFLTADNGGKYYELPAEGKSTELNLNLELAKSRVLRNRRRLKKLQKDSRWEPSTETKGLVDLSDEYYHDARKLSIKDIKCGQYAQKSLNYALYASEAMELDNAHYLITQQGHRPDFFMGCDARSFIQMDPELFMERFTEIYNYATITHYNLSGYYQDFERVEGQKEFGLRQEVFNQLKRNNITVEGRPLYWPYKSVTPDWLRNKSYDQLLLYIEDHVRKTVGHYGDGMYAWEVVNESHDWANELQLKPDQITQVTKLACEVAKDTNPNVGRLINNCCPFAEYVQLKKWGELDAKYPQRTPHQFMQDLVDAEVDFTITGQQMYFPYRDLQDTILLVERLEEFGRPVQLTEVGASSGPTKESINSGRLEMPTEPYIWRRPWDEELQADWLEGLYTLAYSKPWIEAVNWYDFVDPYSWIKTGGMLRSTAGEPKASYHRLLKLQNEWKAL
ncbi:MAG: endo-1,4-beta-xylanase [Candidatus Marinimicrobia bacterium]|nr:endo-1,4-beta-xylanase [Candidatus Neomarinimicrobiota bacterium]MCF7850931.1 endo-1,4-beta-xylanase [Candidatus Neomarinimicrobiota bacterium]MCF7905500.1 endo-1,4-beta-xylanase [Candidatus Neomarinimicrobiota bacterium]